MSYSDVNVLTLRNNDQILMDRNSYHFIFLIYFSPTTQNNTDEAAANVCQTSGCLQAATTVLQYINTSVDPCTDFYDFACGKFISSVVLTDEKYTEGSFSVQSDQMQKQLRQLIDSPIADSDLKYELFYINPNLIKKN